MDHHLITTQNRLLLMHYTLASTQT